MGASFELTTLVGNDTVRPAGDVPLAGILGMHPQFWPPVGFGQRGERLAFVKERVKSRQGTALAEPQRILGIGWRGIGWQRSESGLEGVAKRWS